jgi:hypothetical protein
VRGEISPFAQAIKSLRTCAVEAASHGEVRMPVKHNVEGARGCQRPEHAVYWLRGFLIHGTDSSARAGQRRFFVLNKFGSSGQGEAKVQYLDGDFRVISPGAYVRCAVTGTRIPLEDLKYWSVDRQEAYATPEAVLERHQPGALRNTG